MLWIPAPVHPSPWVWSELTRAASALQVRAEIFPHLTGYSSSWKLTQCSKVHAKWKWSENSFSGCVQNNVTHTDQDSVECHLPAAGKEECVARNSLFPSEPLAPYCCPLTNNDQLGKTIRNPHRCRLLPLKRKQQLALVTIDLIFLAPTSANVISPDVLKQKLK